ncbi:MAG: hypothetical protein AAFQ82_13480, partial [Myxococcota bacterium]
MIALVWSLILGLLHRGPIRNEREEKGILALMLLPLVLTVQFGWLAGLLPPVSSTEPSMDWAEPSAISAAIPKAAATIAVAVPVERTMLAVYLLGCAVMLTRLVLSRRRLLNLETQAVPFAHRDEVRLTDHPITPFVGPHRSVVVPAILVARLTRRQLDLVIEHENIHIERR